MRSKVAWSCTTCVYIWKLQPLQYIATEHCLIQILYVVNCKHLVSSGRSVSFIMYQKRKRPNLHRPHIENTEMKPKLWDYVKNGILQRHKPTTRSCMIGIEALHSRWLRLQTHTQNIYNIFSVIQQVYLRERALVFPCMYIFRTVYLIPHPSNNVTLR